MDKEKMIKEIIKREDLPFAKDDAEMLGNLTEGVLSALLEKETKEQKEARLKKEREDLQKEVEKEITEKVTKDLRETLTKEAREQVRKDLEKKEQTILDLQKTTEKLEKDVESMNKLLETESDLRKEKEFEAEAVAKNYPGDINEHARTMLMLDKTNPEALKSYRKSLAAAGTALKATGIGDEIGSSLENDLGNEYAQLQDLKAKMMKDNPSMKESDAWRKVVRENPELYKSYTKARRATIKAHGIE